MPRIQIALDLEVQRRARQRASDLGVSLAEYLRRLITRDLAGNLPFDLGRSGGSDVGKSKDAMIGAAFASTHRKRA